MPTDTASLRNTSTPLDAAAPKPEMRSAVLLAPDGRMKGRGAVNALLGNQVTSYFGNYTDVSAHIASGQLRALAVATPERIASLPGVPTVAESIHKSYAVNGWFGLFAPAKTSSATGGQIGDWFKQAMQDNEVREKLQAAGLYPANSCGANFAALIHRQSDLYGQVIQERHITLN